MKTSLAFSLLFAISATIASSLRAWPLATGSAVWMVWWLAMAIIESKKGDE